MWLFNSGGGLGLLALGLNGLLNVNAFSPSSYPQKVANCHAFNRVQNESHPLDIKLRAFRSRLLQQPASAAKEPANESVIPLRLRRS